MANPDDAGIQVLKREVAKGTALHVSAAQYPLNEKIAALELAYETKYSKLENELKVREQKLELEKSKLKRERSDWEDLKGRRVLEFVIVEGSDMIELKFGSEIFSTSPKTLFNIPESLLANTAKELLRVNRDKRQIKIDRSSLHFGKILDFFRDGDKSLHWLKDERINVIDLRMIQDEAEYYNIKRLVKLIKLEIAARSNPVQSRDIPRVLGFAQKDLTQQMRKITIFETREECVFDELNLACCTFQNVHFKHTQYFFYCQMSHVTFQDCSFSSALDFSDSYVEGVRFVRCKGYTLPEDTFVFDEELVRSGKVVIPHSW